MKRLTIPAVISLFGTLCYFAIESYISGVTENAVTSAAGEAVKSTGSTVAVSIFNNTMLWIGLVGVVAFITTIVTLVKKLA